MDAEDLFAQEMGKVKAIRPTDKINKKKKPARMQRDIHIKEPAITFAEKPSQHRPQDTDHPWIIKASGMSQESLKKLASGKPAVSAELDLHGMIRDEALAELELFVEQALACGQRVIAIIHGRGLHSQGKAVLKDAVYHWLRQGRFSSQVLAAIPAPYSGGGACWVLFRRPSVR